MDKMLEKFQGSIFGLAIGDALGMPSEWLTSEEIKEKYGVIDDFLEPRNKFEGILKAGTYTDDTDQMIAILKSFDDSGFNNEIFIQELIKWYKRNPIGIGSTSKKAIQKLIEGDKTGCNSSSSGSAMRVGPLGLYYYDNYGKLKETTIEATKLTHNSPEAIAAALSVAFFVAESINGEKSEKSVEKCSKFIEDISLTFSEKIMSIANLSSPKEAYDFFKTGLDATECVPSAISGFVLTNSFKEGMISVVNAGGDTDSMGSMYGAISGAYYGIKDIPNNWTFRIKDKELFYELSKKLHHLKFEK
ncbi:ADP-ribosylation/Crystallin J1 [Methanococcus vannielii SB]|jgi:ADP-ribosylglycohydrolase|uniref:ADP-ribosylation/Crystallin J1 n=1 Tax=Methanococcus vannielii (strain ATCC 35089 / DSM 1224 / JCM 13029 / OCM 148 / SB) TaxID=406327 RepID=A6USB7_METVS|nr:ADP-ribosylglycohydrolase family protein [Methanococcus vannielii]ABR55389.1 ADP-ribosylation/Crystallin J1 [Methanococcus vannielii SB]